MGLGSGVWVPGGWLGGVGMGVGDVVRALEGLAVPRRTPEGYGLVSADSHVNEPRDLWTSR